MQPHQKYIKTIIINLYMSLDKNDTIEKCDNMIKDRNKDKEKENENGENENHNIIEKYDDFSQMNLKANILRGIYSYGFSTPSVIQQKAIMPMVHGKDIIAQSQSGTGKTGAFVIGTLQKLDDTKNGVLAIIMSPTRELAHQIQGVFQQLGQYTKLKSVLCVGGTNISECRRQLNHCPAVVIGTPGRIIDMIERNYIYPGSTEMLVIDEADEMLSNSFQEQLETIVKCLPNDAQICLFSATIPKEMLEITNMFMRDPINILVKKEMLTLQGISQFYIDVQDFRNKFATFCDLYKSISVNQSIVYVNTKRRAEELYDRLKEENFTVSVIHSRMRPFDRTEIMKQFRGGSIRVLISTDLLSRGIDVQQVSVVINYDLPNNNESYLHRIGRSGRYGRKGLAINFITRRDYWKLDEIKKFYDTEIGPLPKNFNEFI